MMMMMMMINPVHSANVPDKAAKTSGAASTAVNSYHTLYYCFTHSIKNALQAWGGFLSVELKNRINAFFKRLMRFGYINCVINRTDYELFNKICSASHSLYHLIPPYRTSDLRQRIHPFQLPDHSTDLHKKSFIVRSLYQYIK